MSLLNFNNRKDIPIKWSKLMLEKWSAKLQTGHQIQENFLRYLKHFLGLVERYRTELGTFPKLEEALKTVVALTKEDTRGLKRVSELNSNKLLWAFWQKLLVEHREVIASTSLEGMI